MTYEQALQYIGSRLRFGIKPGLERMTAILDRLGNPQKRLEFIHVAGTNGKGSVSTMIASALSCAGKRTGLYTSPYICDFRERMQIDGEMIPKNELADLTESVMKLITEDEQVTEFELITCIALQWFAERGCDAVVLEVGLGGRLDATNIIDAPLCSVIMRIDLDHTAVLGDTIAQIAGEKAGIIKRGCPVVMYPDQPDEAAEVISSKAEKLGCSFSVPNASLAAAGPSTLIGRTVSYKDISYTLPLLGSHQILNSITAVEALRIIGIDDEFIAEGISKAHIPARFEVISHDPLIIIDGAHNPNGASALAAAVDELLPKKHIISVMGILADKDYSEELEMLGKRFARIYTADGYNPRALSSEELCKFASEYTEALSCSSPEAAFEAAFADIHSADDVIIVCGSLYLAGYLRSYIINRLK